MTMARLVLILALVAAPLGAEAQQARVARIGYLSPLSAPADFTNNEAFRQGLRALGYVEGQNITIESRYADGRFERLRDLAAELVRLNVDVIVAAPTPAVRAAQQATRTVPIVMAFAGDPVSDFVAGLAQPGGNITGLSATVEGLAAKRVEFLKTIGSHISRVAYLADAATLRQAVTGTEAAGRTLGVQISTVLLRNPTSELEHTFSSLKKARVGGLIVSLTLREHWRQIVNLAIKNRLPTVSGPREFVEAGGLLAYGPHYPELFRRAATYVDKILKGAKPGDLPIEQASTFELVINLKTAKALGLTLPQSLLLRADRVIE